MQTFAQLEVLVRRNIVGAILNIQAKTCILQQYLSFAYFFRYTIYSPKDGQPCMDHDRQTGEVLICDNS